MLRIFKALYNQISEIPQVLCMKTKEIRDIILKELPAILEQDKEVQALVLRLSEGRFADKEKTEDRFDKMLRELATAREADSKKWEEQDKKWAEQEAKWQENQKEIRALMASLKALDNKNETIMGAIGARWGMRSEQSFRNALKGLLSTVTGLEVTNVVEYDAEGFVFGRPDQVELDLVVKNGLLIICEIKSSVSKPDIYIFLKKAEFYQKQHFVKADRLIVISPMIDKKALELAKNWGIKTYSYVDDIEPEVFSP